MTSITKADAARLVSGRVVDVVRDADGNPIVDRQKDGSDVYRTAVVPVSADTILHYRVYDDRVVVVTIDGQKLTGPLPAAARPAKPR